MRTTPILTGGLPSALLVVCSACSAGGSAEWDYAPDLTEPPSFDADAALEAVHAAIDTTRGYAPEILSTAWDEALAVSPTCPSSYSYGGADYWFPCQERRRVFDGTVARWDYSVFSTDDLQYEGWYLYGAATLTDPSADDFLLTGTAYALEVIPADGSGTLTSTAVQGAFTYAGAAASGTWLAEGAPVDIVWTTFRSTPAGAGWTRLERTAAGLPGAYPELAMSITEYEAGASDCDIEPAGTVSMRDASGTWTDVVFDAWPTGGLSRTGGDCDGCGQAWRTGQPIGEVCLDTPRLLETNP